MATSSYDVTDTLRDERQGVVVFDDDATAAKLAVDRVMRREAPDLLVAVDVPLVGPVALAAGAAIRDDQRWCVRDPRLCEELHRILVERHDRQRVLGTGHSVERERQVEREVATSLVRNVQSFGFGR